VEVFQCVKVSQGFNCAEGVVLNLFSVNIGLFYKTDSGLYLKSQRARRVCLLAKGNQYPLKFSMVAKRVRDGRVLWLHRIAARELSGSPEETAIL
jgi:hypothetical protein